MNHSVPQGRDFLSDVHFWDLVSPRACCGRIVHVHGPRANIICMARLAGII